MARRATGEDVMRFIRAIAPEAPELYLASFSEAKALNDAADLIAKLRAVVTAAEDSVQITSEWLSSAGCEGGTPDGSCEDYRPHDLCGPCTVQKPLLALEKALAELREEA